MSAYIAELIGFAIFIGLIWWQIVPRVVPLIDRRRDGIRASIEGAASIREAAENERDRRKQMLEEANTEGAAIIEQAREAAARVAADARSKAAEDETRIRHDAGVEIELRAQRAREEVAAEMGVIVVAAAEQVVLAEIDGALQRRLVNEVIAAAEVATVAS
jgi:ATP synthase F0 subunit b